MPSLLRFGFPRAFCRALALCGGLIAFHPAVLANDPGGGAAGVGASVTLTATSTAATLNNGVINAVIDKATGRITTYTLNGVSMIDTGNPIYYSMDGGTSYEQPSGCVYSVVTNTTDMVEISCKRTWNATAGYKHVFDIDLHYVLRRGDTGLYAFAILDHPASYPAATVGEWRIVWKLPRSSTTFTFERAYVDDLRHWEMPSYYDYQQASATGIAEIVKLNTGVRAGKYDGKYSYSARYFDIGTWGHASNIAKKGVWFVLGGHDYFNDGPTKQDLTLAVDYLLMHFGRNHYDGSGTSVAAGESWRKMYGPFLLYCNATTAASNAGDALWADAQAQVAAEKAAWPYTWLVNSDHPAASGRGTVTGKLVIADALKPSVSAAGAYLGLAAPEDSAGNWQFQGKGYQYWTRADAAGNFTLPGVRPGSYTLYAYNDGVVGEYSKTLITVTAGGTSAQGTLTWTVAHPGTSIAWEIGTPDRTAREFRHGTDYFEPYLWNTYPAEFPNPLVYTVGTSTPANDWNYVQSSLPTTDTSGTTTYGAWNWQVNFTLPAVPSSGDATLTVAFASSNYARLWLYVNGEPNALTRISPPVDGGNALLRQGIHAKYSYVNITIPVSRLKVGANTFTFNFSTTDQSSHVMYDYLRLELPAFPPPPPSSGRSITWKGGATTAANTWDADTTAAWLNGSAATTFGTGDKVLFDDTGANTTGTTLTGTLQPESVTVNAAKNYTFSGTGALDGAMALTKAGAGTLTISQANTYTGQTTISAGTLALGNDTANTSGLGTSAISLAGGTLAMTSNASTYNSSYWNLDVPSGSTGTLRADARCDLYGKLTGGGVFNYILPSGAVRTSLFGDWSGFTGRVNATAASGSADFRMALDYSWPGLPGAALNLGAGVTAYYAGNLNSGLGTFVRFGELSGSGALKGGATGGRQVTYRIGGLNTDAAYSGAISEQTNGLTNLVKAGSGVWTYSGTGTFSGATTVEAGTLRLSGGITNPASTTTQILDGATLALAGGSLASGLVHISTGGALSGFGTLAAPVTNDDTVTVSGGTLSVTGAFAHNGALVLAASSRLDVSGAFTADPTAVIRSELGTDSVTTGAFGRLTAGSATLGAGTTLDLRFDAAGSAVNFASAFWTTAHTWSVLTAGSLFGTLALGAVSPDSLGHAASAYGRLTVKATATSVDVVWTPLTTFERWQMRWFGSTTAAPAGANADPDGDGQTNAFEQLAGTDPTDPASRFAVNVTRNETGGLQLTWPSLAGQVYQVQSSPDLTTTAWGALGNVTATSALTTYSPAPSTDARVFYRIATPPP